MRGGSVINKPLGRLLWVDMETTGLLENQDKLLELGLILTAKEPGLEIVAEFEAVIHVPAVRDLQIHGLVRDMHERNGLFDDVERSRLTLRNVEELALAWVEEHDAAGLPAAGSGVHFDRRWAGVHLPRLAEVWNYQNFDLTTLRRFWGTSKINPPHRALLDLRQNVRDMRGFVRLRDRVRALVGAA